MKKFIFFFVSIIIFLVVLQTRQTVSAAPTGNYLELNGGYVKTTSTSTNSPSFFSFNAWIKPSGVSGIQKIISIGNQNTNSLHYEVGINGGSLSFTYRYGLGSQKIITAGNLTENVWSRINVFVSNNTTKLSINDQTVYTTEGAPNLLPIGDTIVLGGSFLEQSDNTGRFIGAIDAVYIPAEGVFIAIYPPVPSSFYFFWPLDESRGQTTAYDYSSHHLDGQLIGGDSAIHFFGIIPTPTPYTFALPTIRWIRPTFPVIGRFPTNTPTPTYISPSPTNAQTIPTISDPIRTARRSIISSFHR